MSSGGESHYHCKKLKVTKNDSLASYKRDIVKQCSPRSQTGASDKGLHCLL